jgi:hypothetical protein
MPVDAPKIAAANRNAVAIEEFKNLNSYLAAIIKPITQLRRCKLSVGCACGKISGDRDDLRHRSSQKKMIMRHLVELPHAAE